MKRIGKVLLGVAVVAAVGTLAYLMIDDYQYYSYGHDDDWDDDEYEDDDDDLDLDDDEGVDVLKEAESVRY